MRKKKLPLAADSIYKAVFAQWLAFDLTELNFATLPAGLGRAKKTVLTGTFCLQIEKIWDAGSPCYAQYRKLIGTENSNAEVTANDQSQNFWEPKPRRLLMMEISDGVQQVKAMEYKSIPRLSMNTSPGTKVKLVGSIQCRLGVLLLSSGDLEVLGGQVDSLVEKNAAVKVLAAKLGISPAEVQPQKPVKTEMENESNETNGSITRYSTDDFSHFEVIVLRFSR